MEIKLTLNGERIVQDIVLNAVVIQVTVDYVQFY